ncbi:hypothetical protein CANARDRAFT_26456 [[Candida] arabinofermentans NRRL YB-2248]|uniref:Uncharacterized protein n=1 Tax=[Candida] arabinofermentans NRRL YB-2248 TaxID=983967 RepID=A0A1E4T952_9ASCO|nr:hypothetical protein CANARDRAFT_26456 [[Candida] arabinofermentans NRRL YB-2248]
MTATGPYERLPDEEPSDSPPDYESLPAGDSSHFEQFEIEELESQTGPRLNPREFFNKAGDFAKNINARFFRPINNALDPVYELYRFINAKAETLISKVGNPLIIKRLLYVFFIAVVIYMVSITGIYPNTPSTLYGDLYDTHKLYSYLDAHIDLSRLEENLEYLSSMPHMSGTVGDMLLGNYVHEMMEDSSLTLERDSKFTAYTNYPNKVSIKLQKNDGTTIYECNLIEDVEEAYVMNGSSRNTTLSDINNDQDISRLATNPGSKDGNAKGHPVYANYGTKTDYKVLESKNIDLNGAVVIVKYGGYIPEFKKIQYAYERGAVGVLFISDPTSSSVYTMGSIQREPVASPEYFPGNMLSPGFAVMSAIDDDVDISEVWDALPTTPKIPSIPISWNDFKNIMKNIESSGERIDLWDVTFNGNNGKAEIWAGSNDYQIVMDNSLTQRVNKELWNIVGKIQGSEQSNFDIIIGASRDSTCFGAVDATGTAVMLELISIFSSMVHNLKWRPLRSIYFVSFTGTQHNLAGSTNFGISNKYLRREGYAYIDLSDAISGADLEVNSDPMLYGLIQEALTLVDDPKTNKSLINSWDQRYGRLTDPTKNYLPFASHFGVSSVELKFKDKKNRNYPKNSCHDSFKNFQDKKIDPQMQYHKTLTSLIAKILIQLAQKPVIPFDIFALVSDINKSFKDLRNYVDFQKKLQGTDATLDFTHFETSLIKFKTIGRQQQSFIETWTDIVNSDGGVEPNLLAVNRWDWNSKLTLIEKILVSTSGTYNRPWYGNVLYGEELTYPEYTDPQGKPMDFDHSSFPGVRNAVDAGDWKGAADQLGMISELLDQCLQFFQMN